MSQTQSHITTAEFTEAAESNLIEKSLSAARLPGGKIVDGIAASEAGARWYIAGPSMPGQNGVVKAIFPDQEADKCIEATLRPFKERGVSLTWWTGPSSRPANLGTRLQFFGFTHNRDMIGMSAEIDHLSSPYDTPPLKIERVQDAETLAEWHPLSMRGFNTPASMAKVGLESLTRMAFAPGTCWHHFYVRKNGQVVAISSIYINDDIAGLYNLVTDNEERGQGIGAAMTLGTFAIARELGCRIATLQTTYSNALRLYHRLGFEVYCKFGIYQHAKFW